MASLGGTGHLGVSAALASILALGVLVRGCPPPGSQFAFRDGFFRNGTDSDLAKRWTAIQFGSGAPGSNLDGTNHFGKQWSNGVIPVCFDPALTASQKAQIIDGLERGMGQWYASGLSDATWRLEYQSCNGVTGRTAGKLWVQHSAGGLASHLGDIVKGSEFDATTDDWAQTQRGTDWQLAKARGYAHELGHVFGLIHEHQSPLAWSWARGGTAQVDTFAVDCTALADYDRCYRYVKDLYNYDIDEADEYMFDMCLTNTGPYEQPCRDTQGNWFYLSATNWLPQLGSQQFVRTGGKIDMRSIMLYSSFAGSKVPSSIPVLYLVDSSGTRSTFQPDDGYSVYPPSQLDVEAAIMLSPNPRPAVNQPPYFTNASPLQPTWESAGNGFASCSTNPAGDCNAPSPDSSSNSPSNPFADCHAESPSRKRGLAGRNRRHEGLVRRGAEARAAMMGRLLATGSYF